MVSALPGDKLCVRRAASLLEQQYVQLVEEKEEEMQKLKVQCLRLMERHISQQMKHLDEISVKLNHSMKQRLQKEKVRILRHVCVCIYLVAAVPVKDRLLNRS